MNVPPRSLVLAILLPVFTVTAGPIFIPGPDGPQGGQPVPESISPNRPQNPFPPPAQPSPDRTAPKGANAASRTSGRVSWPDDAPGLPALAIDQAEGVTFETYVAGQAPAAIDAVFLALRQKARAIKSTKPAGEPILTPEAAFKPLLDRLGPEGLSVSPLGQGQISTGEALRIALRANAGAKQALAFGCRPEGRLLTAYFAESRSGVLLARAMAPSGSLLAIRLMATHADALEIVLTTGDEGNEPVDIEMFWGRTTEAQIPARDGSEGAPSRSGIAP